ncbi:hypothetical protein [Mesorhizobium muleiense]|uniref:hypothetical protein n=1 Tax=Mesorhizobium muleiense TaxID=1004279 RepID=UPI001F468C92|nr:hypothetical protein [Mesorhizobium muleiense]MCF6114141.1 hypothetical protein [Mesorhizobium muleiense]
MVAAELATGYSALKTAYDMAKGLKDIDDRVKLNAAIIDLQEKIQTARDDADAARHRLIELQAIVAELTDWQKMAARYCLKDFGGSTFAYELRSEFAEGEPIHKACPKCFQDKKRAILQYRHKDSNQRDHYKCNSCSTQFELGHYVPYQPKVNRSSDWRS